MEKLSECELLAKHETTLSETSIGGTPAKPMTTSTERAVNIDDVMKEYTDSMPDQDGRPPSVDALTLRIADDPVLVEFKSGRNFTKDEIRIKLLSTLLMLVEVAGVTVSEIRSHMNFLLVYDRKVFCGAGNDAGDPRSVVQQSESRGKLIDAVQRRANLSWVPRRLQGLGNGLEGVFVKRVKVVDKGDLTACLAQLGS